METSQPLAIESFSYSWLINQKPSPDRTEDQNSTNPVVNPQTFCFHLPYATNDLVDAQEIFCNGRIIPNSVNQMKLYSCPATPMVHFQHNKPSKYSQLIADWRVSTKKVFRKCFRFLVPRKSTRIVDSSRNPVCVSTSNTRIEVHETTFTRTKSWSHSSISRSHFSCDYNDGSVHEAIVHCKRSLAMVMSNQGFRKDVAAVDEDFIAVVDEGFVVVVNDSYKS
ncbi:hypothetical protein QVD17_20587 [Tagetes erecta]|uniref:Uncharacterized protein n=1 Tax=Tagetes erecta TaxID=13708 RepID=A0AAD8NY96_TARER|nr:hypothetical protein QVD17_20587 [Tagetes erecta]